MAPLLSVNNLVVEFPTRRGILRAIDNVSFEIARGETLGVVGESGAGKSLTGRAVIGLLQRPGRIASGEVWLDGTRIDQMPAREMRKIRGRRIGMIFQDPLTSLNPLYTVRRQLVETILTHTNATVREAEQKSVRLLDAVGIPAAETRLDSFPHQFSGGMRQRVVIALALSADPDLIIADEPTTALDVSVQAQVLDVLKTLGEERGTAVLLITHDMGVIAEATDRVMVMYAGRRIEMGPSADVIHAPKHPYTVGLMGAIPNPDAEADRLTQIPGAMPSLKAIPPGCAFHPRCERRFTPCDCTVPAPQPEGGSSVACHLYGPAEAAA
ncbi:MAG: ABC transporter ATP-binding protein [Pseudomonadota bacterium]